MKIALKHQLSRLGILPHVDSLRRLTETSQWIEHGCSGIAPSPVKRKILMAYLRKFRLRRFIETGTHVGDTLAFIAYDKSIKCTSIELDDGYYEQAKARFASYSNIELLHGDSSTHLPMVTRRIDEPALFWLDGHYSGGTTARGSIDTPVSDELKAILESSIKKHVILIDDARCFDGSNGYPNLDELLKTVREDANYRIEVSTDIIRIMPC